MRIPSGEFERRFFEARPRILGALLDAASAAMRNYETVSRSATELPRMSEFVLWSMAAESALGWDMGSFRAAYLANRAAASTNVVRASTTATAIAVLMQNRSEWTGTATELLGALESLTGKRERSILPKGANHLSAELERLLPALRRGSAIEVRLSRGRRSGPRDARQRLIEVRRLDKDAVDDEDGRLPHSSTVEVESPRDVGADHRPQRPQEGDGA
jgi:hypothetical protein